MNLFKRLFKNTDSDSPPWVKGTKEGRLYIDESDERYQKFLKATIEYYSQWKLINGNVIRTKYNILKKPIWEDFV